MFTSPVKKLDDEHCLRLRDISLSGFKQLLNPLCGGSPSALSVRLYLSILSTRLVGMPDSASSRDEGKGAARAIKANNRVPREIPDVLKETLLFVAKVGHVWESDWDEQKEPF